MNKEVIMRKTLTIAIAANKISSIVKSTQKRKKTLPRIFPLYKNFKQNKLK